MKSRSRKGKEGLADGVRGEGATKVVSGWAGVEIAEEETSWESESGGPRCDGERKEE